jgi:tRNA(Ile)-lysidine synthase TilS/MesJ
MKCLRCGRRAAYELRYSGHWLCGRHFGELFERRVKKTIRQDRLLGKDDHVVAAVSGGKNSMAALRILFGIMHNNPRAKLEAVTVEEGGEAAEIVRAYCASIGVPHHTLKRRGGVMGAVDGYATKAGAGRVATGENLDHAIREAFADMASGNPERIGEAGRGAPEHIRILGESQDAEVGAYAKIVKLPTVAETDKKGDDAFGRAAKMLLDSLEERHPGSKYQMLRSTGAFAAILGGRRTADIN